MAELTDAAAEVVADVAKDAVGQVASTAIGEMASGWSPREGSLFMGGAILGLIGGLLAGYGFAGKRLRAHYAAQADEEITTIREHYYAKIKAVGSDVDKPPLDDLVEDLGYEAAPMSKPDRPMETEPEEELMVVAPPPVTLPVDEDDDSAYVEDDWDYADELASRSPVHPYVIHRDEVGETNYTQSTLTYYEGDDILCDDNDSIIEDKEMVIGETNLNRFGHGSNDRNVVFVRNDAMGVDVEVCRSKQSYAEEVHGFTHAADPPRRRGKFDDE